MCLYFFFQRLFLCRMFFYIKDSEKVYNLCVIWCDLLRQHTNNKKRYKYLFLWILVASYFVVDNWFYYLVTMAKRVRFLKLPRTSTSKFDADSFACIRLCMFHSEILALLNFKKNKILSPELENNHTLKCCSGNFPS